jgi:hypothetical protein
MISVQSIVKSMGTNKRLSFADTSLRAFALASLSDFGGPMIQEILVPMLGAPLAMKFCAKKVASGTKGPNRLLILGCYVVHVTSKPKSSIFPVALVMIPHNKRLQRTGISVLLIDSSPPAQLSPGR